MEVLQSKANSNYNNEKWKIERIKFFDQLRDIQERANLTPEEAEQLANEAVNAVRNSKYSGDK